jgi:hypothetical protein
MQGIVVRKGYSEEIVVRVIVWKDRVESSCVGKIVLRVLVRKRSCGAGPRMGQRMSLSKDSVLPGFKERNKQATGQREVKTTLIAGKECEKN